MFQLISKTVSKNLSAYFVFNLINVTHKKLNFEIVEHFLQFEAAQYYISWGKKINFFLKITLYKIYELCDKLCYELRVFYFVFILIVVKELFDNKVRESFVKPFA